ncbi:MAG: heavy-metal-associated domain-containing protein [Rhodospirillales bacterium]|nr:MAG: heavy-metal-associated domain-containing protein [Rhodospirillales bacterium]
MSPYVHHVPGRLRIRTAAIKRRPDAAERARRQLAAIDGVTAADANALTGSLTLRYDPARIAHHDLIGFLRSHGYGDLEVAAAGDVQRPAAPANAAVNELAETAVKTVAVVVLEKLIERSTVALIGAIT